jgi:hypothetical protein
MVSKFNSIEDIPPALAARFGFILGSKVERSEHIGECWVWPTLDERGYGKVSTYQNGRIIKARTHRIAWLLLIDSPIRPGLVIRHLCGNASCVNPYHLADGTQVDNAQDAQRHGTLPIKGICVIEGCTRPWKTRKMCGAHAERVRSFGDPVAWLPIRKRRSKRSLIIS